MSFLAYQWNPRWVNEKGETQGINSWLIADSPEQILATRDYYVQERGFPIAEIPRENGRIKGTQDLKELIAYRAEAFSTMDYIEIAVQKDFTFSVNVNAWSSFVEEAKNIEVLRKGALYRWSTGVYTPFDYYLPERVMLALKYTDLRLYSKRAREGLQKRNDILEQINQKRPESIFSLDGLLAFLGRRR